MYCRFYSCNNVKMFSMKRPFHKGIKDKENEFAVSQVCSVSSVQCNSEVTFSTVHFIRHVMLNSSWNLHNS